MFVFHDEHVVAQVVGDASEGFRVGLLVRGARDVAAAGADRVIGQEPDDRSQVLERGWRSSRSSSRAVMVVGRLSPEITPQCRTNKNHGNRPLEKPSTSALKASR